METDKVKKPLARPKLELKKLEKLYGHRRHL